MDADPRAAAPWAALEAAARTLRLPCGEGEAVWRIWGAGPALLLLHGGAGSWLHWLRTIPAFAATRTVIAPDLPGLGESAPAPVPTAAGIAAVVDDGLNAVLGPGAACDLAGFSLGGVIAGFAARRRGAGVRSLTLVGSGGLGAIRQTAPLERVRGKSGDERREAHRTNLQRWMLHDPARIDALALAIQDWNGRRARLDSRGIGVSDLLLAELPEVAAPVAGIWGAHDHAVGGDTGRVRDALHAVRPDAAFHVVPDAGHWVAYEAPAAFDAALHGILAQDGPAT